MRLGLVILTSTLMLALGGCPPVPTDNGNDNTANDNSSANVNNNASTGNDNSSGNDNATGNGNDNSSANVNSNSSANTNSNTSANTNSNSSTNANSNSSNGNDNSPSNENSNTNANTNSNDNTNGNVNENSNSSMGGLSASEQLVATEGVRLTRDSMQALGLFAGLAQATINFDTPGNIDVIDGCPEIAYVRSGSDFVAAIDFKTGCASDLTNDVTISGVIELILNISTHLGEFELMNIVIGGVNYAGTAEMMITGGQFNPVDFVGSIDITNANGFGISGNIDFEVTTTSSKTVTVHSATLALENNDLSVTVTVSNLVASVINSDSFVPQAGSITFDTMGSTFVIEFDADSPSTNTVQVMVDADAAVSFTAGL